jgi:hypothetical protein
VTCSRRAGEDVGGISLVGSMLLVAAGQIGEDTHDLLFVACLMAVLLICAGKSVFKCFLESFSCEPLPSLCTMAKPLWMVAQAQWQGMYTTMTLSLAISRTLCAALEQRMTSDCFITEFTLIFHDCVVISLRKTRKRETV